MHGGTRPRTGDVRQTRTDRRYTRFVPHTDRLIGQKPRRSSLLLVVILLLALLVCSRYIASTLIDYEWWSEVHQLDTWINLLLYGTVPIVLAAILLFCAFWSAFKIGIRHEVG